MTPNSRRRLVAAAIGGLLTITACSSDGEDTVSSQDSLDAATPDEDDVTEVGEAESTFEEPTSNDVDCSDEGLGADDMISFTAAHHVVDGELGALCNGAGDERIFEAWDALATIAPRGQLGDLGVFTAFEESGAGDEITLAFVQPLDADGTVFQMSINLDEYEFDPDEALLTMAHEFSHVFTATPAQIDRSVEAAETCTTYDNGEGCFLEDSLIFQWVDTFWVDYIDDFDPFVEASGVEGEQRCSEDAGFLGPYAASNPEEDFAESFSAYVFDVEAATPEQQERLDWMADQPGLVEFHERAVAAGLTPVRNGFEVCGVG